MATAKPVHKIRAGQVSCALWENELNLSGGRKVKALKATLERRYKDSDGTWKSSGSFGRNEIPLAVYCLQKAFEYIIDDSNTHSDESSIEEETIA
jgi:hypothetical protein